jgi:hypothetical protein
VLSIVYCAIIFYFLLFGTNRRDVQLEKITNTKLLYNKFFVPHKSRNNLKVAAACMKSRSNLFL